MSDERAAQAAPHASALSALRSKPLWIAILVTLTSAGWWIYQSIEARSAGPTPVPTAGSGLVAASQQGGDAAAMPPTPVTFTMGASFVGGFALAWLFRRFVKAVLLVAGVLVLAIAGLKASGLISLDWSSVESQVDAGVAAAQEHASSARDWLWKALPSGTAAMVGGFFGFRRS